MSDIPNDANKPNDALTDALVNFYTALDALITPQLEAKLAKSANENNSTSKTNITETETSSTPHISPVIADMLGALGYKLVDSSDNSDEVDEYDPYVEYDEYDEAYEKGLSIALDRALDGRSLLLNNGLRAYIDRALDEPDHRGVQFFGVVEMFDAYQRPYFKQSAWDENLQHNNGKHQVKEFSVDIEAYMA